MNGLRDAKGIQWGALVQGALQVGHCRTVALREEFEELSVDPAGAAAAVDPLWALLGLL